MELQHKMTKKSATVLCILLFCLGLVRQANSQVNPFGAGYFSEQYLFNPAMAGSSAKLLDVHAGYREETLSVADSPSNAFLTGTYGISDKIGLGLNVYQDHAGLMKTIRVMGTFAWHVMLNETSKLSLGLSAGMLNSKTDDDSFVGEPEDPYKDSRFDADFGAAFSDNKFMLQAAFPCVTNLFNDKENNHGPEFFSAMSYAFSISDGENLKISVIPKLSYRDYENYDDVFDAGLNLGFLDNRIEVVGMYHTTENITVGLDVRIIKRLSLMAFYTSPAPDLKNYSDGSLEFGTSINLGK